MVKVCIKIAGGLFDQLVQVEQLKDNGTLWLIANGYLAEYEAYCPPIVEMNLKQPKSLNADFTKKELENGAGRLVRNVKGDIVKHYRKLADNKTAIIFCPNIDTADQISQIFKKERLCVKLYRFITIVCLRICDVLMRLDG